MLGTAKWAFRFIEDFGITGEDVEDGDDASPALLLVVVAVVDGVIFCGGVCDGDGDGSVYKSSEVPP